MSIRIAFTGSSGTGKTTLARYLTAYYGLSFNPIGARSVADSMGYASPYDVDKDGRRLEMQRKIVREKRQWEDEHASFVTDRTTVDNLAYTALHDVGGVDQALLDACMGGLTRYTHVILCPAAVHQDLGGDPARKTDKLYHQIFEALLVGLYKRSDTWVQPLYMGNLRARQVFLDHLMRDAKVERRSESGD